MVMEWRNVGASNKTPAPYETITISGEVWHNGWFIVWFPPYPAENQEVTLTIDDYIVGKTRTRNGYFSFTIGAPGVPGPYTYVLTRTDPLLPGDPRYLVGIEVIRTPIPPVFVETYRGIDVYLDPEAGLYFFTVAGARREEPTLASARAKIDGLLAVAAPEIPLEKIILYGSIGLIGLGLVWMAVRS